MRHRLESRVLLTVSVLVTAGLLACGGDRGDDAAMRLSSVDVAAVGSGSGSADGSADAGAGELEDVVVVSGPEADVEARDNTFDAENIQVAPGTKVVWTNNGRQDHDIVPVEDGAWGVQPEDFVPDAVYEHTFDEPGTYRYYCSLHGTAEAGMTGAIVVAE